jgi:hypothetical protein
MEYKSLLPPSQKTTTYPYSEPDQSIPLPPPTPRKSILILSSHLLFFNAFKSFIQGILTLKNWMKRVLPTQ